ncbi:MAG: hypothetical protein CL878_07260 [Dehalococcoidia bacterium]|nr:hypothetical protein [Dehalococcoidia bacterium]
MSDPAERELLRQARKGSQAAYECLQERLEVPIRRFVRRLVGPHDAEDDIVQDVFLALYLNLGRMDPPDRLRPFLFRMARNRCYDELRRQGRFQAVSFDEHAGDPVQFVHEEWLVPDQVMQHRYLVMEVIRAMERLPEAQRQALILYGEEDLSYEQVAEAMGTTIGTVKSRIHAARRRLRQLVGSETLAALGIRRK